MKKHLYDSIAERWLRPGGTIWIISDPHFHDTESQQYRHSYPGDDELVKRINSKVGKNDTLIILGDVGDISYVKKLKAGYKILILGNHDKGASNYKRIERFEEVSVEKYLNGKTPNELCIELSEEEEARYYEEARKRAEEEYKAKPDLIRVGNIINYDFHPPFMSWTAYFDNKLFDEVYEGPVMINDRIILSHEPIEVQEYMFNIHGHTHGLPHIYDARHLNMCAEAIDYMPVNMLKLIQEGLLKDTKSIHELTVQEATKRKIKRNLKAVDKMLEDLK